MDLVVDTNVIFAAMIKDSFTYSLLFSSEYRLFTPEYTFTEFKKHKEEILEKTERTTEDFFRVLEILKLRINLVPLEELTNYIEKAEKITPDPDDMVYFALALRLNCAIWTNDKKLKNQDSVNIYSTDQIKDMINNRRKT
tara:strand:+ start:412 stop:831 length:420 start_codon:yes stop_codon:yes gene_type:complete